LGFGYLAAEFSYSLLKVPPCTFASAIHASPAPLLGSQACGDEHASGGVHGNAESRGVLLDLAF
jgi:hypothetical protein